MEGATPKKRDPVNGKSKNQSPQNANKKVRSKGHPYQTRYSSPRPEGEPVAAGVGRA